MLLKDCEMFELLQIYSSVLMAAFTVRDCIDVQTIGHVATSLYKQTAFYLVSWKVTHSHVVCK